MIEISSITDLMKQLDISKRCIFRGEKKDYKETSLMPFFGREIYKLIPDDLKNITGVDTSNIAREVIYIMSRERAYLEEYYRNLSRHRQRIATIDLLDAQHRGLPTRLLDWSENPLVALYFATEPDDFDGFFFSLSDYDATIITREDAEYLLGDAGCQGSIANCNINVLFPIKIGQRISRQLGCFTVHKLPWLCADYDFKTISRKMDGGGTHYNLSNEAPTIIKHNVTRYMIPKSAKKSLRNELAILGITKDTLWLNTEDLLEKSAINALRNGLGCVAQIS